VDFCASAVEVYLCILESGGEYASARRPELERRARRGCKALAGLSRIFGNVRPRTWLLRGLLHRQLDQPTHALKAFQKAERIAVEKDMPFERARALLEIARHGNGALRASQLSAAAGIFRNLGAAHFVALAEGAGAQVATT